MRCGFLLVFIPTMQGSLTFFDTVWPRSDSQRLLDLVAQMASFQPAEPHWFLPLIGVDPMSRGRGRGDSDRIVDPPVDRGRSLRNRAVAGYGCNCYGGGGVGGVLSIVPIVVLVR
jgi:hypothetical protein